MKIDSRYSLVPNPDRTCLLLQDDQTGEVLGPWRGSLPNEERLSALPCAGHEGTCFVCGGFFSQLNMIDSGGWQRPVCAGCEPTLVDGADMGLVGRQIIAGVASVGPALH